MKSHEITAVEPRLVTQDVHFSKCYIVYSTGAVTGFDGTVLQQKGEAWWHQELDLGLQIDKLLTYTPASRICYICRNAFPVATKYQLDCMGQFESFNRFSTR